MKSKSEFNNKIKIVLVDDFKLTRTGLRCELNTNNDIEVIDEAESANEGIKIIHRLNPDIVLMDIGLPDMDGTYAISEIRKFNKDVKIIVLTSHHSEDEVLKVMYSGANAYCLKDIEPDKLADVVRDVKMGVSWFSPLISDIIIKSLQYNFYPDLGKTIDDFNFTDREKNVLKFIVKGKSNTEIAKELYISPHTAKSHVSSILQKFNVQDRVQAAVKASKLGFF